MKSLTRVSVVLALLALPVGIMADDDRPYRGMGPGYGNMMGPGYGNMMGPGYRGHGYGMMGQPCEDCGNYHRQEYQKEYKTLSEKEVKTKVKAFLSEHLKGFSISKMEKDEMPRGYTYWFIIKDQNGNEMDLYVNPWGYIRGPYVR
ncbi:hypothetical protein [Sulfurimonas sp.]|uniref:hypothetical protein n=1 Tax=Sulfurimonas sp. TaxID=2022749 RepID=UPI003564F6FC